MQSYQTASGPNQPFGTSFDDIIWVNPGDIDVDGDLDADDIDALSDAVRLGRDEPVFDVNRDGVVNLDDRQLWVEVIHDTSFGDANLDGVFNSLDVVAVLQAGQYADSIRGNSGWAQGDWDGDGDFGQPDIVLALQSGAYGQMAMAAVQSGGTIGDGQTSVIYNAGTGEVAVDAPAGVELTSINIDSASEIFTSDAAANLGGSFDNDADNNIFKATFGSSFGSLSFGNVAQTGLSEEFVLGDLSVIGSLAGGGDLGNVDLVYVPEPASVLLLSVGLLIGLLHFRRVDQ